jgi:hypothetical protein
LRGLNPEQWHSTEVEDKTIAQIIDEHLASDQKHLSAISSAAGAPVTTS